MSLTDVSVDSNYETKHSDDINLCENFATSARNKQSAFLFFVHYCNFRSFL